MLKKGGSTVLIMFYMFRLLLFNDNPLEVHCSFCDPPVTWNEGICLFFGWLKMAKRAQN